MNRKLNEVIVELKPSLTVKGEVGVFAVRDIKKGQKVCPTKSDDEEFISKEEMSKLSPELQEKIKNFTAGTDKGYFMEKGIDFNELPISYYFNHSCEGNLGFDGDGDFITMRNIKKNEELLYDYGLLEADPDFKFVCGCGSVNCRKIITGNDWKNEEFRRKYYDYLYPDLK